MEIPETYRCLGCGAKGCRLYFDPNDPPVKLYCVFCVRERELNAVPAFPTQSGLAVWSPPFSDWVKETWDSLAKSP